MLIKLFKVVICCFALVGVISVYSIAILGDGKSSHHIEDKELILNELIGSVDSRIKIKNCERINSINNLKVSDYFSMYFDAMLTEGENSVEYTYLNCGSRKENECSLSYGGKSEWGKGWSNVLFFNYSNATKKIDKNSFEYFCQ